MQRTYPDDDNKELSIVQRNCRDPMLSSLFFRVTGNYRKAAKIIGEENELLNDMNFFFRESFFYPEVILNLYYHIAAWYRKNIDDHGQLPLFTKEGQTFETILIERWERYFLDKALDILDDCDELNRYIIQSIVYEKLKVGKDACQEIDQIINERFPLPYIDSKKLYKTRNFSI
jgi:hypothetical protein